jgi:hypothetical protein
LSTHEAEFLSTNAHNHSLTEQNEEYKTSALFIQESIRILSEDLSNARERVAQYDTAVTDLTERNLMLESTVSARDQRIAHLSQTCYKASSSAVVLRQALDQKEKEAADWRDLYLNPDPNFKPPRSYRGKRQEASGSRPKELSLTGIIAGKDQEIAQLKDRIAECNSQLSMCTCTRLPQDPPSYSYSWDDPIGRRDVRFAAWSWNCPRGGAQRDG